MFLFQILSRLVRCAGLYAAWYLSLGSYHTETHHYSPPVATPSLNYIIIVKFLLTITTLKIQSDCFGVKHSLNRSTDCSLQQTLPIYYHTWCWNVIKIRNFSHLWSMKKSSKCGYFWVLLSLYNIQDFIFLVWGPRSEDVNIYS